MENSETSDWHRQPQNVQQGIDHMQQVATQRGLAQLQNIFGDLYSTSRLLQALSQNDLNVEETATYLQDQLTDKLYITKQNFPELFRSVTHQVYFPENPELMPHYEVEEVEGPQELLEGQVALEFSLSPHFVESKIPVFFLSDEIVKEILGFFTPYERGRLRQVCKTWNLLEDRCLHLYKRDCLSTWNYSTQRPKTNIFPSPFNLTDVLWGENFPQAYSDSKDYVESFKSWRTMWLKRPRVRFNGVYVSKVSYFKQGAPSLTMCVSFHRVTFYRYIRFYEDFSVCCVTTAKKPKEIITEIHKQNEEARIGEWARLKNKVTMHLLAKNEVFTYVFRTCSSVKYAHDGLKFESFYCRQPDILEFEALNINTEAWPKYFKFFKV